MRHIQSIDKRPGRMGNSRRTLRFCRGVNFHSGGTFSIASPSGRRDSPTAGHLRRSFALPGSPAAGGWPRSAVSAQRGQWCSAGLASARPRLRASLRHDDLMAALAQRAMAEEVLGQCPARTLASLAWAQASTSLVSFYSVLSSILFQSVVFILFYIFEIVCIIYIF